MKYVGPGPDNADDIVDKEYVDAGLSGKANTSHTHTASNISDSTATGRAVLTAADQAGARSAIGAGTSNIVVGTGAGDAKAGNYVPSWSEITGKPSTFDPSAHVHAIADVTGLQTALDGKASLSGAETLTNKTVTDSTFFIQDEGDNTKKAQFQLNGLSTATTRTYTLPNVSGSIYVSSGTDVSVADGGTGRSTSTTAYGIIAAGTTATGAHQTISPGTSGQFLKSAGASALGSFASIVAADVSDSTATGRSVLTATDAAAARSAIGAGTSSLVLGTTAGTAKAGDYVPSWTEITSKPSTFTPSSHTHGIADITATGTPSSSTYLRGDGTWATVAGGSTTLTGEVTGSGTGSIATTVTNSAVLGKVLTGVDLTTAGTLENTSTIGQAIGMTNGNFLAFYNQFTAFAGTVEPTITAGTTADYWRGDKSWQPLNKAAVGLSNVDNTADSAKNVSSAATLTTARTINGVSFNGSANITINAVDSTAREPAITAGSTAQYWRGDKSWQTLDKAAVGLGNVDNTSNVTERAATATLSNKTLASPAFTGTPTGLTKAHVGLGNVDNTADSAKSVSSAATLTTARTINGVSFNGSANITVFDSTKVANYSGQTLTAWKGNQAAYDALGSWDSNTIYFIT